MNNSHKDKKIDNLASLKRHKSKASMRILIVKLTQEIHMSTKICSRKDYKKKINILIQHLHNRKKIKTKTQECKQAGKVLRMLKLNQVINKSA